MGLALLLGVFALCVDYWLPVAFALGIAALQHSGTKGYPFSLYFSASSRHQCLFIDGHSVLYFRW